MTVTSILYMLLVISTNYQLSVQSEEDFHLDQRFNCPTDNNTIQIDISDLRSISLLSPCHPNSYYGQCVYQRKDCLITVYNIPDNMWIGLFFDEDFSVPGSNDELMLLTHEPIENKFRLNSLMPGYIHRFTQYSDNIYTIGFLRSPFPPNSADDNSYKFKIDTRSQNPETCQTETTNSSNEADSTYETTRKGAVQHIYQPIRNAMKEMKDIDSSMRDPATRKGSIQHVYEPIRKEIAGGSTHHEQQEESIDYSYVLSNATPPIPQPPTSSNDSSDDCNDYVGPDNNVRASTDSYIDVL